MITLGYAGWSKSQLETEMIDNTWLSTHYDESVVFDTPISQRWRMAAENMGLDINLLTTQAGHA